MAIMIKNEEIKVKKVNVVKKVDVSATIRQIRHGETVRFARQELGSEGTVRSAVWRVNTKLPTPEFSIELGEYGLYYDITRK